MGPTDTILDIKASNNWQLLTITYDRGTNILRAYNNGVISKEVVINYPKAIYSASIRIGTGDARYFNGLLNDLSIYNVALSSSQIKQNYIAGLNSMLSNGNISKQEYNERLSELAYEE